MNGHRRNRLFSIGVVLALGAMTFGGCAIEVGEDVPRPIDEDVPEQDVVTVRFRNFSIIEAVHVEFFASTTSLSNLPDDLFVPENSVTASIGVAGTGIIVPLSEDVLEFPCTDGLILGTTGGSFVDNETGAPLGVGMSRWVQEGPLALCGHTVTFEYFSEVGAFMTVLSISR